MRSKSKKVGILVLGIVLVLTLSGCVEQTGNNTGDIKNLNLTADISLEKPSYTAKELINFNVDKRYNHNKLYCNCTHCTHGCGGAYYPGSYYLHAEIKYKNESINFTISNTTSVKVNLH